MLIHAGFFAPGGPAPLTNLVTGSYLGADNFTPSLGPNGGIIAQWEDGQGNRLVGNAQTIAYPAGTFNFEGGVLTSDNASVTSFTCDLRFDGQLQSITFLDPRATTALFANNQLTTFDANGLVNVSILDVGNNAGLTTLSNTTSLTGATRVTFNNCDVTGSLDLSGSTNINNIGGQNNNNLTALTLPNSTNLQTLTIMNCDVANFTFGGVPNIITLDISGNNNFGNPITAPLTSATTLDLAVIGATAFALGANAACQTLNVSNNNLNPAGLDLTGLAALQSLTANLCQLQPGGLTMPATIANLNDIRLDNNSLSAADLDAILIALDAAGTLTGALRYDQQTAPSAGSHQDINRSDAGAQALANLLNTTITNGTGPFAPAVTTKSWARTDGGGGY